MCVVEIQGDAELKASCETPAAGGMIIRTESPQVVASRKQSIARLLSMGNHNCAVRSTREKSWTAYQLKVQQEGGSAELCPAWGDCRLQDLAYRYQVAGGGYANVEFLYPTEMANPFIIRTTCSYCGVGCQMDLHVKDDRIVRVTGAEDTPPTYGSLCVKGRFGFDFVSSPERLTVPLIKENGKFREATWDEALDLTARRFSEIKKAHGADSIGVLTSARVSSEDNYIAMKFTRAVLKTNNIDHCARL